MTPFQLAMGFLMLLNSIAAQQGPIPKAIASVFAETKALYEKLRQIAKQNREMTEAEEKVLDEHAEQVFASAAANPELNV